MKRDKNKSKNDNELEIVKNMGGMIDLHKKTSDNMEVIIDNIERIISIIEALQKTVSALFFLVSMLIWRVFLWDPFNRLLDATFYRWDILSEGYKILILSLIGSIPAMIIAHMISLILLEKIKKVLDVKKQ